MVLYYKIYKRTLKTYDNMSFLDNVPSRSNASRYNDVFFFILVNKVIGKKTFVFLLRLYHIII